VQYRNSYYGTLIGSDEIASV